MSRSVRLPTASSGVSMRSVARVVYRYFRFGNVSRLSDVSCQHRCGGGSLASVIGVHLSDFGRLTRNGSR